MFCDRECGYRGKYASALEAFMWQANHFKWLYSICRARDVDLTLVTVEHVPVCKNLGGQEEAAEHWASVEW